MIKHTFLSGLLVVFLAACGSETQKAASSVESASATNVVPPLPGSGGPITGQRAKDMVDNYARTLNAGDSLSKYSIFYLDSLEAMVRRYKDVGADHVKIYFAVDSTNIPCKKGSCNRLAVVIQPGKVDGDSLNDIQISTGDIRTYPYDLSVPCNPPKCQGKSNYYISF